MMKLRKLDRAGDRGSVTARPGVFGARSGEFCVFNRVSFTFVCMLDRVFMVQLNC